MLDDLTKSIKANLYERAVSPLFGTFVVSWVIWNYKFLFVLGSSMEVHEKFEYIECFIYTDALTCLVYFLIYPLITTAVFIFAYPYPSRYVYEYWHRRQKELKEIKQIIDDETPLTKEESRAIRRELLKLESEYDEEITRKESEINRLKDIVKDLQNELNTSHKTNTENKAPRKVTPRKVTAKRSANNVLSDEQFEILTEISNSGGIISDSDIYDRFTHSNVKMDSLLEDIESKNLISRGYKENISKPGIELTAKGKKLMVNKCVAK